MPKRIEKGDKVRCIATEICLKTDCRHHGRHRHRSHEDCRETTWCPEVGGWVRDRLDYPWPEKDECPDPNQVFRRKKER